MGWLIAWLRVERVGQLRVCLLLVIVIGFERLGEQFDNRVWEFRIPFSKKPLGFPLHLVNLFNGPRLVCRVRNGQGDANDRLPKWVRRDLARCREHFDSPEPPPDQLSDGSINFGVCVLHGARFYWPTDGVNDGCNGPGQNRRGVGTRRPAAQTSTSSNSSM
jgi:hypothetical protein